MLNYAKLADISHWQKDINFVKFSNQDLNGVIIRAGSINYVTGIPYADYRFEINSDKCAEHFDVLGFYWFWRANQDPRIQAEFFANLIKYKKWNLPPIADVETSNNIPASILVPRLKIFLDILQAETGKKPLIYTRASFWNLAIGNLSWANNYDLWCARYRPLDSNLEPDLTGPWSDGKFKPANWNTWKLWQYSADGNNLGSKYGVGSDSIDLNYFNGTKDDLYKYAGILELPEPPSTDTIEISKKVAILLHKELETALG